MLTKKGFSEADDSSEFLLSPKVVEHNSVYCHCCPPFRGCVHTLYLIPQIHFPSFPSKRHWVAVLG